MRVLHDTNILLDVFQFRQPHYRDSAMSLNISLTGRAVGYFSAHAVPTLYYILNKYADRDTTRESITWVLGFLEIVPCDRRILDSALNAPMVDFEDAIVAQCARFASCDYIVTRNTKDFPSSHVPVSTPSDFLARIQS